MKPQDPGCHRSPGLPGLSQLFELVLVRKCLETLDLLRGLGESQVSLGPDIGSAQGHQKIDVCGPSTDSHQARQSLLGLGIRESRQSLENDLHQGRESRLSTSQRWLAMLIDHRRQIPIARGEVSHSLRELILGQHASESGLFHGWRGVAEHGNDLQVAVLRRKALSGIAVHIL